MLDQLLHLIKNRNRLVSRHELFETVWDGQSETTAVIRRLSVHGTDGAQFWLKRYERELGKILDLQDDLSKAIVSIIAPKLLNSEREQMLRQPPESLGTWDSCLCGSAAFQSSTEEGLLPTIIHFGEVNCQDSYFAPALVIAANAHNRFSINYNPKDLSALLVQDRNKAQAAMTQIVYASLPA